MAILTEEQLILRDAAKSWVQEKSAVTAFRRLRSAGTGLGFDPEAWKGQAAMGWAGVVIPETFGGSDFGYLSMGLILEEMGRTLTASPLFASGLAAASAIKLGASNEQKATWLPKIADGSFIATLAIDEDARHTPERVATVGTGSGRGYTITGRKTFVIEGPAAGLFIVSARTAGKAADVDGISLFLVKGDAAGMTRQNLQTADGRGVSHIRFEEVDGELMGEQGRGWPVLDATLDRARAGISAEMLGMAAQAFETTLDYLKTRAQFGQVIGSFQALQHRAARMFTELELGRSVVEAALQAIDKGSPEVSELASLAKAKMGDTLHLISNEMIQMPGGIGMTDAHDAGLYLKRARACAAAFGNQALHRERYAQLHGF
jgi:alkylation response protein AidB-like acyl-CoA dehydrogenase